jgi:hypothetical protein
LFICIRNYCSLNRFSLIYLVICNWLWTGALILLQDSVISLCLCWYFIFRLLLFFFINMYDKGKIPVQPGTTQRHKCVIKLTYTSYVREKTFWKTFKNPCLNKFSNRKTVKNVAKSLNTNYNLHRNVSAVKYKLHTRERFASII